MTKAEKQISDLRYKMREISAVGQNEEKKKEWKEKRTVSETHGTIWNISVFELLVVGVGGGGGGDRRGRKKERAWENIGKDHSSKLN